MIISANTQLGIRFKDTAVKRDFLTIEKENLREYANALRKRSEALGKTHDELKQLMDTSFAGVTPEQATKMIEHGAKALDGYPDEIDYKFPTPEDDKILESAPSILQIIDDSDTSYYLIAETVYKCAELIKIKENFTGRTLKDIKFGKYTYLMGKNRMCRFVCGPGYIKGYYYNDAEHKAFDWHIAMASGNYYFPQKYGAEFSLIMQVLTFVELGDIEVLELAAGKNNGKPRNDQKEEKIHNSSNYTVFVVDSNWNKIVIRDEGFGVRGHYKMQPCGPAWADRKLIWVNAFEKEGYTRKAKAEIRE